MIPRIERRSCRTDLTPTPRTRKPLELLPSLGKGLSPWTSSGGEALTGSVHILDLPDPAAARTFA
ncbi:hypothetical protein GTY47_38925 [Streptomyces sp. SID5464]|nr:hypothetical protein [Streptomyces sp. SID5464]